MDKRLEPEVVPMVETVGLIVAIYRRTWTHHTHNELYSMYDTREIRFKETQKSTIISIRRALAGAEVADKVRFLVISLEKALALVGDKKKCLCYT